MRIKLYFVTLFVIALAALTVGAQTNTFTYQGRLTDNNLAAVGTYEMQFRVFDAAVAGNQLPVGTPVTLNFTVAGTNPVTVSNGAFTVQLNFGANVFTGADRWLEISVRKPSDPPGFTLLTPRQPITSSPYAIKTINANAADSVSAACVLCITDAHISGIDGAKVTGAVANATNAGSATTAGNVTGVVAIANGGTGSATKNFVDLTTTQSIGGNKTFTSPVDVGNNKITSLAAPTAVTDAVNKQYVDSLVTPSYFQSSWVGGVSITAGAWGTIPASSTAFVTTGKPLLITMNLSLNGGSHAGCRPTIDGNWAGTYSGMTGGGDPFWQEGIIRVGILGPSTWARWTLSKVYAGVPAGFHTFAVQCATDGGTLLTGSSSIGSSWGAIELK